MSSVMQLPSTFIDTLNDDCLSEIFSLANLDWDSHRNGTFNTFSISQVSRRWRNVSLSRAELWSTMVINEAGFDYMRLVPGREMYCNPSAVFPTAALMLKRSRQHPLDIHIELGIDFESSFRLNDSQVELLATLLSPHARRISQFTVRSPLREHQVILTNMFAGKTLPLLRSLRIMYTFAFEQKMLQERGNLNNFVNRYPMELRLLESAPATFPNLEELILEGIFCDWGRFSVRQSLTTLVLGILLPSTAPTAAQLFGILKTSKDTLRNLTIKSLPRAKDPNTPNITLEFPSLEYLSVTYGQPTELSQFIDHIHVPALTKLKICGDNPNPAPVATQIYTDTLEAFQHVMDTLPLSQIEKIHLGNLQFGPAPDKVGEGERLPVPYRFFQRLEKVQCAEFHNAWRYVLDAANYHLVASGRGSNMNMVVMPELRHFTSRVLSKEALEELVRFLRDRKALGGLNWGLMELQFPMYLKDAVCACREIRDASVRTSVLFRGPLGVGNETVLFGPAVER